MTNRSKQIDSELLEIQLLLEGIYLKHGYDFRNYEGVHLKRRLAYRMNVEDLSHYSEMLHKVLYEEDFFQRVLFDLSVNVTEMFRDPWVYKKIREEVVPRLLTYPFIRAWHAGCGGGQEVYSMCILFAEEGVGRKRVQVYATDMNERLLEKAKGAIYPVDSMKEYTKNYQLSGGRNSFSDYYSVEGGAVSLEVPLRDRVLFSVHNLATDNLFGEMNVIFCRNVLIYFNKELQNRVLSMFYESLCPGGFLCLGSKESLAASDVAGSFEVVCDSEKIFRKKRI